MRHRPYRATPCSIVSAFPMPAPVESDDCAETLLELVNDLLDLAKIEAGKIEVQPIEFAVTSLFSALRGMLRPLLAEKSVHLVFDDPGDIPMLYTDESKVSQILRNFIANALKFTERGEVRVEAQWNDADGTVTFSVADTGFGIALEDQERIFEEFTQLNNPVQSKVKGTGLGLPLCRKLATLLGGKIELKSELGVGSTFYLTIPAEYIAAESDSVSVELRDREWEIDDSRIPVLVVEDEPETRLIYEKFLRGSVFHMISAGNLRQARDALRQVKPRVIVLDILLRGEDAWRWLVEIKTGAETKAIPVLIATTVEDEGKGYALGADEYFVKPLKRELFLGSLARLTGLESACQATKSKPDELPPVLIIDDEAAALYILAKLMENEPVIVHQASNGPDGVRLAREIAPVAIFLDLDMPEVSGFEILKQLKADSSLRNIPVAIVTSLILNDSERRQLESETCAIIRKSDLSRPRIEELLASVLRQPAEFNVQAAH